MTIKQLSFWDNKALENGYQQLANLNLRTAKIEFQKALDGGQGEEKEVIKALEACKFWDEQIRNPDKKREADHLSSMLTSFLEYPFPLFLRSFKKNLFSHISTLIIEQDNLEFKNIETLFDLLLKEKFYEKAETLIRKRKQQNPEDIKLKYMLSQVMELSGNRHKAYYNYALILLHHPQNVIWDRIQNKTLENLIEKHGAAMTPAFAWLQNIMPPVPISELTKITPRNAKHKKALDCYCLIHAANNSLKNNDHKSSVQHRKKLKELSPELYEKYFSSLQRKI